MGKYIICLDWKNQYCENDYTTKCNLHTQCNTHQITNGIFHRTRAKIFTIPMEALACLLSHFSHVQLSANPWTMACQASLSIGFSRQEYWSGLPFPSPFVSLGRFILRYFILFIAMVNGIDSLISLSDISFLVYRNPSDFCVLIFQLC